MICKAKMITQRKTEIPATVQIKPLDDRIFGCFFEGSANEPLDSEFGAEVVFSLPEAQGMTALVRVSEYWCEPVFVKEWKDIPDETQLLIVSYSDGTFTVVLPVVSQQYKCVLYGNTEGIHAKLFTWMDGICECRCLAFTAAERITDPFDAVRRCFLLAAKAIGRRLLPREERVYPELFEYLGWCSWDALQIRVSEAGLLEKCREFNKKQIPVRWAIIDDMWATVPRFNTETYASREEMFALMHTSPLADFEAEPKRFPSGLRHTVSEMKRYLTWVGIWHPTTGYWFGIDPKSRLYTELAKHLMQTGDGRYIVKPTYADYTVFLNRFHTFLADSGADFVKIDNQSIFRLYYKQRGTIGETASAVQNAIEDSAAENFGGKLINCMGCASENIWNRSTSAISRCSDDFQPENKEWFTHHILQCAYTCLMQSPVIWSDWDMWWSGDAQGKKNSVIRAISGGPVYVSDKIGESVKEIIMPLVLNDGRVLRCNAPAMPTDDCFADDPRNNGKVFKLQNMANTSGVLAVFDLDPSEMAVTGAISPDDVRGVEGDAFAVYESLTGETFTMEKHEKRPLSLKNRDDFRLYTFTPIKDGFAVIGRKDKMIPPLTVKRMRGRTFELYEEGPCLVYRDGAFIELNDAREERYI